MGKRARGRRSLSLMFDVDKPGKVLLPYSKGMEEFGTEWDGDLPAFRRKRISWIVRDCYIAENNEQMEGKKVKSFVTKGMVAGMWRLKDTKPERYNIC